MLKMDKTLEQLQSEIRQLRSRLKKASSTEDRLHDIEKRYRELLQSNDSLTREIYAIRSIVNMPQLYLDDDLRIVGYSADFVRQTTKVIDYAREGTDLSVLVKKKDVDNLREYLERLRALENLPYEDGEAWQLCYSGPTEQDRIGGQWTMHTANDNWKFANHEGKWRLIHLPHTGDRLDCCLLSAREYGGPSEDVRLVYKTRTSKNPDNILDNTCFISATSGKEAVMPDINGYTVCLGSNYNSLARIQKQGADVVSRHEILEPDTEYLVEVERIGGRVSRRATNLDTGEEMPLLYFIDFDAIYDRENHIGFYTYSGEAHFYDIEIYTRPSRFDIEQFCLPFQIEITPRGYGLKSKYFELKYVRNELMGKTLHTLIFNDITTRKAHESRLRESEEKYRKLFEEGRVARSTTTPDGRFIDVNKEMERLTGYTREELCGSRAEVLYVDPEDRRIYIAQLERDTYVRDYELKFKKKDGTLMDCMITSSIHPSTDGSAFFIEGSIQDVTERKRMEAKLKEVQKMEVIGRIASGVAHEVRNPLNAILAISEALNEEIGDQEAYKPYMDHICSQVDRLSTLMNDLLELGKPLKTTEFMPAAVFDICRGALELWRQSSSLKSCTVVMFDRTDGARLKVLGNSSKLKQVVLNLLENAAQHSPEGETIELELSRSGENRVIIRVTDQGPGIPNDVMPEVFKPFYSTRVRGSGLGLSIVKNIVETHGGTIEMINNDPPPGLRAEVTLPLFEDTGDEA